MNIPKPKKYGKDEADDYGLVGDLLQDPEIIKELLPKSIDEIFDMLGEIDPKLQELQEPVMRVVGELTPILQVNCVPGLTLCLQELPYVLEEVAPTAHEIAEAIRQKKDVSDRTFIKWGKKFKDAGAPLAR